MNTPHKPALAQPAVANAALLASEAVFANSMLELPPQVASPEQRRPGQDVTLPEAAPCAP
jgi:hypothetical protein